MVVLSSRASIQVTPLRWTHRLQHNDPFIIISVCSRIGASAGGKWWGCVHYRDCSPILGMTKWQWRTMAIAIVTMVWHCTAKSNSRPVCLRARINISVCCCRHLRLFCNSEEGDFFPFCSWFDIVLRMLFIRSAINCEIETVRSCYQRQPHNHYHMTVAYNKWDKSEWNHAYLYVWLR